MNKIKKRVDVTDFGHLHLANSAHLMDLKLRFLTDSHSLLMAAMRSAVQFEVIISLLSEQMIAELIIIQVTAHRQSGGEGQAWQLPHFVHCVCRSRRVAKKLAAAALKHLAVNY